MDEDEALYCHHDDTDEYHDCLDYMECEECPYYYADLDQEVEQMTNADKIRNMTDEELFNLIGKIKFCGGLLATEHSSVECRGCNLPFCCPGNADMKWLKKEVE